ncbi:hypothetical protein JS278_02087 [Acidipropionibacterium virtanenii]|uniref:Prepilin type IV endopeptidase peptidase domain-containing protein n=1 Tax=Acidipropionibacterium virtanenii TaxID=2057246 RepID=A0A344UVE1_9ACTN|nr:hypothetical protein JS278_02087 [Acidipropionibacterium virtanenii]
MLIGAAASTALALSHLLVIVPMLPEPDEEEVGSEVLALKPRYRSLVTARRTATLALIAALCGGMSAMSPAWGRGLWWVWAGSALTLIAVDQATTFLPRRLWAWCLIESLLALAGGAAVVGLPASVLAATAALAVAATVPFWLMWRLGGGLGFGDVRLAGTMGLTGAALGTTGWALALFAAAVAGALLAIGITIVRRFRPSPWGPVFAYGPALWVGPWAALAIFSL